MNNELRLELCAVLADRIEAACKGECDRGIDLHSGPCEAARAVLAKAEREHQTTRGTVEEIGNFDICKAMAKAGQDIRMAPLDNITSLRKVKAGTQVTIGVEGDLVAAIGLSRFVGGLLLIDRAQYFVMKTHLEAARRLGEFLRR